MNSIVKQLTIWVNNNSKTLHVKGIRIINRIPDPQSNLTWKAGIGLLYKDIIVSYTVWERTDLRTELIIMNSLTKNTIILDDKKPEDPYVVHVDLDQVIMKLLDSTYKNMEPDPKLIIT